jgi:CRP/FNR family cyclic AMP-dependent transcriptional regulator
VEHVIDQPISLDAVISFLVASPLFADLDPMERAEVVRIMEIQRLQVGEEIFREGDPGDSWYVIFEGQVEVTVLRASGTERQAAVLDSGASFGEMAMLDGAARSATVRAVGPLTVFRFRRPHFEELLGDGSLGAYKLILAMAREMSVRLRRLTREVSELVEGSESSGGSVSAEMADTVERNRVSE